MTPTADCAYSAYQGRLPRSCDLAGWMANRNSVFNSLLSRSVAEEWGGIQPLWVREGGSIPSIPFLEQLLDAPAVHFPCV